MKRLMILLALSVSMMTTHSVAAAAPTQQPGFIQFCKGDVAINTQFTLGDCVGFVATFSNDSPGFGPQLCDFFRVEFPDIYNATYSSYSECVQDGGSAFPF